MKVHRYFYIGKSLDDLASFEGDVEQTGIERLRIHVLSLDDSGVEKHSGLHEVESLMKTDVMRSAFFGLVLGAVLAVLFIALASMLNWPASTGWGWVPFVFGAIVILGFTAWEGGFIGIQRHNQHFRKYEKALQDGDHVFFVDIEPERVTKLDELASNYSSIHKAGTARSAPRWLLVGEQKVMHFLRETMP